MEIIEKEHKLDPNLEADEILPGDSRRDHGMEYILEIEGRELGFQSCKRVYWDDKKVYVALGYSLSEYVILECPLDEISHLELVKNFVCICFKSGDD